MFSQNFTRESLSGATLTHLLDHYLSRSFTNRLRLETFPRRQPSMRLRPYQSQHALASAFHLSNRFSFLACNLSIADLASHRCFPLTGGDTTLLSSVSTYADTTYREVFVTLRSDHIVVRIMILPKSPVPNKVQFPRLDQNILGLYGLILMRLLTHPMSQCIIVSLFHEL